MSVPVIAIDGPSASGKGTIAKRVAEALGYHYLESGALYRLVALLALRKGIEEEGALAQAAEGMDVQFLGNKILLEKQDVNEDIRREAAAIGLTPAASTVSPITGQKGNVEFLLHLRP